MAVVPQLSSVYKVENEAREGERLKVLGSRMKSESKGFQKMKNCLGIEGFCLYFFYYYMNMFHKAKNNVT